MIGTLRSLVLVAFLSGGSAEGQGPTLPPPSHPGASLKGKAVFAGITFTSIQRKELMTAIAAWREASNASVGGMPSFGSPRQLSPAQIARLQQEYRTIVRGILTPHQRERFDQNMKELARLSSLR